MKSDIFYTNPNFSIVLPGPCQAKCDFCFWYQKPTDPEWMGKLKHTLDNLPDCFEQISITGGEPTLSPYFESTLAQIGMRRKKYKKVVLTTNGVMLLNYMDEVDRVVDHVNISRHHWDDAMNAAIFKTTSLPSRDHLQSFSRRLKNKLTFNCVINKMTVDEMYKFLAFSHGLGVDNVCFRQEHATLDPVAIEKHLLAKYKKTGDGGCPVCRSSYFAFPVPNQNTLMDVGIKYSILEPKDAIDGIYELIYHSDGKLTADWEAAVEIDLVA